MQVGKLLYPVTTLGPGTRLGIWTTGCRRQCPGCANPELQETDPSKDCPVSQLLESVRSLEFDGVTVSGGEPFLQAAELRELVSAVRRMGIDDILVFTGYTLKELRSMNDEDVNYVLSNIAVLVDGPFVESEYVEDPLRGSANQNVIVLNPRYQDTYDEYRKRKKTVDIFNFGNETHFIGIPSPGYDELYRSYVNGGANERVLL